MSYISTTRVVSDMVGDDYYSALAKVIDGGNKDYYNEMMVNDDQVVELPENIIDVVVQVPALAFA